MTVGLLAPAPDASAATFGCEASALRGTLLGSVVVEPVVANRGAGACRTASAGLNAPLPVLLTANAVSANTSLAGPAGQETAFAAGGVTDIRVLALPQLPITLPTAELSDALGSVTVPITGLLQTLLGGLVNVSIDLRPALQALLPNGQLPLAELVRVQGAMAYAGASCRDGAPRLEGSSSVTGVSVLGQQLPVGQVVDQALSLIDTASIDPSNVDLSKIVLPLGLSFGTAVVGPLLQTAVQTVLDALPPIAIPATLAQVRVTPGAQARSADRLVQQALRIQVAVAGQSLVDLVVGEATVRASGDCPEAVDPGKAAASALVLGCTTRRLVLTDVQARDGRVRLLGVADPSLAGQRVGIRFKHSGKIVARATVAADGSFRATAPLPARRLRPTNHARYEAVLGKERSLQLKLQRRMVLSGTRSAGGKVTLSGRVIRPLASPSAAITVTRRVSCQRNEVVARVRPKADGTFRITVNAPRGELAAVYRMQTRVRKTVANRKTFQTFTLPRSIALG
ncbi:MAG: hypothetical protein Q8O56_00200 [Solirubrobacteraceae bacterium]|nr:hypothetical protein [Solirubrobacteraceae bacterium]